MKKVLFLLGQLTDRDVAWMIQHGNKRQIDQGLYLIHKGEPVDCLYLVLSGKLNILGGESMDTFIAQIGSGEVVGEMSFLESRPPAVNVVADEPSDLFAIPRQAIIDRLSHDPEFSARFFKAIALFLSNRLRSTTDSLGYGVPEMDKDQIDMLVLDHVGRAGSRFTEILNRFLAA